MARAGAISACLLFLASIVYVNCRVLQGQSVKDESEATMASSMMDGFDTNKDGKISFQELSDHVGDNAGFEGWQAGFKEADADKDGHLTAPELASLLAHATQPEKETLVDESEKSIAESVMDGFDTDKDGKLSLKELKEHVGDNKEVHAAFQGWEEGFQQADVDNDGHLTISELGSLLSQVSGEDQHKIVEDSEESIAANIMAGFDNDKDGKLSLMELVEHIGKNKEVQAAFQGWETGFKEADVDKDGHLTVHELATLLSHVSREDQQEMVEESEASIAASILDGFDTNKDGKISLKELMDRVGDNTHVHAAFAGWTAGFKEADVDNDGHLTQEELTDMLTKVSMQDQQEMVEQSEDEVAASIMDGFDTDKDGKLSLNELKEHVGDKAEGQAAFQGWEEGFTQADADQDGHLTVHELASLLSHVSRDGQHEMVHESEKTVGESILEGFDADKDGKLSLKELMEHVGDAEHIHAAFEGWQQGFDEADADKDGHLTAEEVTNLISHVSRQDQQKMVEESHAQMYSMLMDGFDSDKNGKLSLDELKKHMEGETKLHAAFKDWETGFKEADADNDEHLSTDELQHFFAHVGKGFQQHIASESEQSVVNNMMKAFDADKNDKVSLEELMEHVGSKSDVKAFLDGWQTGFVEADADKDGHLTSEEMKSLVNHVTRDHRHKLVEQADATAASVLDGFDTNKDGKISLQELEEKIGAKGGPAAGAFKGWQTGFNEADADSDGYLTADELASWFQLISEKPKHDEM